MSVVVHLHRQLTGSVRQLDGRGAGPRVADDVGQRLLHDPERCQIDARRERPTLAVHFQRDPDAGRGGAGHEVVKAVQARRRRPGRLLAGAAQHAEHRADLAQGVGARLVDRRQRDPRLLGLLVHQMQGDAGLDVDQRDVVRQHVVELLGDAQPLLVGLAAGLELASALDLREALPAIAHPFGAGQRDE